MERIEQLNKDSNRFHGIHFETRCFFYLHLYQYPIDFDAFLVYHVGTKTIRTKYERDEYTEKKDLHDR